MSREITRFDLNETFKNAINYAVTSNFVDAAEIFCMTLKFGNNPKAIIHDLVEAAYANRHSRPEWHSKMCQFNDQFLTDYNVAEQIANELNARHR